MADDLTVTRLADLPVIAWKNGAGSALDVVVAPPGTGWDDFGWRVNVAMFDRAVPFSGYPGIDRTLAVLDGGPFDLVVGDHPPVRLDPAATPYPFPGDVPTEVRRVASPVRVLNVLARRVAWAHDMARLTASRDLHLPPGGTTVIVPVVGEIGVRSAGTVRGVAPGEVAMTANGPAHVACEPGRVALVVRVWPAGPGPGPDPGR